MRVHVDPGLGLVDNGLSHDYDIEPLDNDIFANITDFQNAQATTEILFNITTAAQLRGRLLEGQVESMRAKLLAREVQLHKSADHFSRDCEMDKSEEGMSNINDINEVQLPQESKILPAVVLVPFPVEEKLLSDEVRSLTAGGNTTAITAEEEGTIDPHSHRTVKELKALLKNRGLSVTGYYSYSYFSLPVE